MRSPARRPLGIEWVHSDLRCILLSYRVAGCRSAGRVQSVALRLICEREAGIEAFVPRQYWTVEAEAAAGDGVSFAATLVRLDRTEIGETGMAGEAAAREAARRIREARFRAVAVERDTLHRPPNPPFATATLQLAGLCCKLGEGAMRDQGASCSPYDSALARRSCSHAMASVRAHGPRSKARSTIRASPTMPPWRANIPAWPLRSARITSKPLIVA